MKRPRWSERSANAKPGTNGCVNTDAFTDKDAEVADLVKLKRLFSY